MLRHVKRLTTLDGSFLRVETSNAHMHVAWCGLFAIEGDRPRPTLEQVADGIDARLGFAPRFRQRLAFPPPGMGEPYWVDDPRFHVRAHVTRLAPETQAVSHDRFMTMAGDALSQPLLRDRPLWHLYFMPRLEDGKLGIVFKMHHALVDGKSAVELGLLLFDADPDTRPMSPQEWKPSGPPGALGLTLASLRGGAEGTVAAALRLTRLARPGHDSVTGTVRRAAHSVDRDLLRLAPASFLNAPLGPRRILVGHRARIEELIRIKRMHGVTVNDVCLAAVAGSLRALALSCGEPVRPLKAMVPVSVRTEDERTALGNRISFAFVELPLELARAESRLMRVHEQTEAFKSSDRPAGFESLMGALGYLPNALKTPAAKLVGSKRVYNLTVSNIPGPRFPVYMSGATLREAYPVVPLAEGHTLSIGMFSYRDWMFFGLYADPEALPEVRRLPGALERALWELRGHRPHGVRRRRFTPKRGRVRHLAAVS
jgi:diacylglycerol O-acyltransferase / wax synthase